MLKQGNVQIHFVYVSKSQCNREGQRTAAKDTPRTTHPSSAGHIWLELEVYTNGYKINDYGFESANGLPYGSGTVITDDNETYQHSAYCIKFPLTTEQYTAINYDEKFKNLSKDVDSIAKELYGQSDSLMLRMSKNLLNGFSSQGQNGKEASTTVFRDV